MMSVVLGNYYWIKAELKHLNIYTILLAPSFTYHKTTCLHHAQEYLASINPMLIFPQESTPESFYSVLSEKPNERAIVFWNDMLRVIENKARH
jgi:hypothetical protein